MATVWTVTYVDDEVADEVGSKVFTTEKEAGDWADAYVGDQVGMEGDARHLFAYVEKHEIAVS